MNDLRNNIKQIYNKKNSILITLSKKMFKNQIQEIQEKTPAIINATLNKISNTSNNSANLKIVEEFQDSQNNGDFNPSTILTNRSNDFLKIYDNKANNINFIRQSFQLEQNKNMRFSKIYKDFFKKSYYENTKFKDFGVEMKPMQVFDKTTEVKIIYSEPLYIGDIGNLSDKRKEIEYTRTGLKKNEVLGNKILIKNNIDNKRILWENTPKSSSIKSYINPTILEELNFNPYEIDSAPNLKYFEDLKLEFNNNPQIGEFYKEGFIQEFNRSIDFMDITNSNKAQLAEELGSNNQKYFKHKIEASLINKITTEERDINILEIDDIIGN